MRLVFSITYEVEMNEEDLLGDTPKQYFKNMMEEDPEVLIMNADIKDYRLLRVEEDEAKADEEEDEIEDEEY